MVKLAEQDVLTTEVLTWQGLHLFHFWGSSCSQKLRIYLSLKGAAWTGHEVNLPKQENFSTWYLGINPRGLVPCLVDDGAVHIESNDILLHLEDRLGGPPLIPDRARIAQLLRHEDDLHLDLRTITFRYTRLPGPVGKSAEGLDKYRAGGSGTVGGAEDGAKAREIAFWQSAAEQGITDAAVRAAAGRFRAALNGLEERLQGSQYLLGHALSLLDIAWYVYALRLRRCGYPLAQLHPRVSGWLDKLHAEPGFADQTVLLPELAKIAAESQRLQHERGTALPQLMGVEG
ncbi:Glutathione S-transferase [Candidatus Rhodobacter oscarellae]|uniref:Glutathione S-transferase n=1 Tax=Candidatus Rhodobacter oscarellae TaxID=1675527 RepID=A0A0J9E090_9RHOB|nr:glutathione S-transferase family protein [Candidatus Rhodobacter lobularis]KMW56351.1 Glutathione S-transferase [Candidatus Rhodobacter lobularis]